MASKEENLKRFQEIANRGLQDQLPADKRAVFDEVVRRGLITLPSSEDEASLPSQPVMDDQPSVATDVVKADGIKADGIKADGVEADKRGFWQRVGDVSSNISAQINRSAQGVGETALQVGTGMVAEPLAGLAGIATMREGGRDPSQTIEGVREALTYQPRSQAGQQAVEEFSSVLTPVAKGVELVEKGTSFAGEKIGGLAGEQGAAVGYAVGTAIPTLVLELIGLKGTKAIKVEKLKDAIEAGGANNILTPESVAALRKQGFTDEDFARVVGGDPVQLERLERFQRQGIQPTRGDVTMSTPERKAEQQLVETAQGESAEMMRQLRKQQSVALQTNFDEMIDALGMPEDLGQTVKDAITSRKKLAKKDARKAYEALAQSQGGADRIPVLMPAFNDLPDLPVQRELRSIKRLDSKNYNALQDALAEFGLSDDPAALKRLEADGVVPEALNIQNFEEFRQALNAVKRADENGNLSRVLNPVMNELDRQVDIATSTLMTSGNPDIAGIAKDARANWRAYLKEFDAKGLSDQIIRNKPNSQLPFIEVSQVYDKIVGRSVPVEQVNRLLDTLSNEGARGNRAVYHMQSAVVADLLDSMFKGSTNKIGDTPIFSGPALAKRFNEPKFNEKIKAIFRNNPEGYRQLEDLVQTAQDLTPGKYEAVKGSGNVMLDLAQTLGLAKVTSVPGIGAIMEQFRDLSARSKNRASFNRALKAQPELEMAANDLVRSFPMLSAALGIGYLSGLEEEE